MKTISKTKIAKFTKSTFVRVGQPHNYGFVEGRKFFECLHGDDKVLVSNLGEMDCECLGTATTKSEFVDLVHDFLNR
jgi:hypothetical protein